MADELNIPTHRWYQKRNHIALAKEDVSRQYIYDSGIQKIDAWINSQPWGDVYIVNRLSPNLVLDFQQEYYRTSGSATTFEAAMTTTRAGNATMTDSDGVLKWAPHNLLTYSEQFDNAAWITADVSISQQDDYAILTATSDGGKTEQLVTSFDGSSRTFSIQVRSNSEGNVNGLINISGTASQAFTANSDWQTISTTWGETLVGGYRPRVSIDSAGDSLQIRFPRLYRSDLGGMVNNPATGDSYVPTTTAARYLPRVGHHIWDGSAWVNEGLLHESEARTNLVTYSEDFTDASWAAISSVFSTAEGPDGQASSAYLLTDGNDGGGAAHGLQRSVTVANSTAHTFSTFAKSGTLSWIAVRTLNFTTPASGYTYFDLGSASVGSLAPGVTARIERFGEWVRCSVTFTTDISDTSGIFQIVGAESDGDISYTRDGTNTFYLYGAQLEAGSTPSSYIPTAGATVTRAADTMTIPAANLPWPEPVVIGPELIALSDGQSAGNIVVDEAAGTITRSAGTSSETVTIGATPASAGLANGDVVKVSFTVSDFVLASGAAGVGWSSSSCFAGLSFVDRFATGNGVYEKNLVIQNADAAFLFGFVDGSQATVSNISVREINPLAVSIQMEGTMTYADTNVGNDVGFFTWASGGSYILARLNTVSTFTGRPQFSQRDGVTEDLVQGATNAYSPGINVPFNLASRHGSNFINGAADGVIFVEDTTPTQLPLLASSDLQLASSGGPMIISKFRMWADDLTDEGIAEASA